MAVLREWNRRFPACHVLSKLEMMNQVKERASEITDKPVNVVMGKELWKPDLMEQEARDALGI